PPRKRPKGPEARGFRGPRRAGGRAPAALGRAAPRAAGGCWGGIGGRLADRPRPLLIGRAGRAAPPHASPTAARPGRVGGEGRQGGPRQFGGATGRRLWVGPSSKCPAARPPRQGSPGRYRTGRREPPTAG